MNIYRLRPLVVLLLLALVGCSILPLSSGGKPVSKPPTVTITFPATPLASQAPLETSAPGTPAATPEASQQPGNYLRIWLPPEFDPEGEAAANQLLKSRLDDFAAEHPDIVLDVRVKALNGTGGLLESLAVANVSAPLSLPDLVLLPRPLLESAAIKGLLALDNEPTIQLENSGWFDYARQLAGIQNNTYGFPFAGDALVLAYHPSQLENPPNNFDATVSLGKVLLFPAADPQAFFTLSLYLNRGGSIQDAQGRPFLNQEILGSIFEYEQRASKSGVMPSWMADYSNDKQVWDAFMSGQYPMAVVWASTYLQNKHSAGDDLAMTFIPTWNGAPFSLATGWVWALAGQNPERRSLSVNLAEYLTDKAFITSWTMAAGYLPPREDAFDSWQEAELRQVAKEISSSAQLVPPADIVSTLGPALEQAVAAVLKAESDPQTAAQRLANQVNQP